MSDYGLIELDELDLVPYISWWQQYFQALIGSCKFTDLVSNQLLIVTAVLLISPPCMTSVISFYLVDLTPSLVYLHMIIFTFCGRLFFWCIPIFFNGIHISTLISLLLKMSKHIKKPSKTRLISSLLLKIVQNKSNGLSVLGTFVRMCVLLFIVP